MGVWCRFLVGFGPKDPLGSLILHSKEVPELRRRLRDQFLIRDRVRKEVDEEGEGWRDEEGDGEEGVSSQENRSQNNLNSSPWSVKLEETRTCINDNRVY